MNDFHKQYGDIISLNNKYGTVTGVLPAYNTSSAFIFPDGFNRDNCVILSMFVTISSSYASDGFMRDWCVVAFDDSRITVSTSDSGVGGKPFKLTLMKV